MMDSNRFLIDSFLVLFRQSTKGVNVGATSNFVPKTASQMECFQIKDSYTLGILIPGQDTESKIKIGSIHSQKSVYFNKHIFLVKNINILPGILYFILSDSSAPIANYIFSFFSFHFVWFKPKWEIENNTAIKNNNFCFIIKKLKFCAMLEHQHQFCFLYIKNVNQK